MGFMDKVKDVGKKALKTVLVAANDWSGKVVSGEYNDTDLKDCLVGTDSQGGALVFYKGVEEICRIPVSEFGVYVLNPDIENVSTVTGISFKENAEKIITIYTKFNKGDSGSGSKIPGVYVDTRGDSYVKFIEFLRKNSITTDESNHQKYKLILELVEKINKIYKG